MTQQRQSNQQFKSGDVYHFIVSTKNKTCQSKYLDMEVKDGFLFNN